MAADIGQHRQRAGRDDGAADRQAVEAVGQVHRVAGAGDDEHHEDHERQERQPVQMRDVAHPLPMTRSGRKLLQRTAPPAAWSSSRRPAAQTARTATAPLARNCSTSFCRAVRPWFRLCTTLM